MSVLLDTSIVLAAADLADLNHARAAAWFRATDEPLAVSALTLGEVDRLLDRALGREAAEAFLAAIESGAIALVVPTPADLVRARDLRRVANEGGPSLSDAMTVALAERTGVMRIATLDRRPFAVMRAQARTAIVLEP
ncbi:MAG TPA: PIN domain-containing protein [Candidatus Limnocylindrales bacterium]|nr:PIN domain-containing protein [Candidatus Limnocylindrales bacterium]